VRDPASIDAWNACRISSGSPYEPEVGFSRAFVAGRTVHVSGTAPVPPPGEPLAADAILDD